MKPACVGNFVWLYDLPGSNATDNNGIQDPNELGIDGVVVTLVIAYPNGTSTTLKTVTGDDPNTTDIEKGWYSFCNLLLDEDYNGVDGSEPTHTLTIVQADNDSTTGGVLIYVNGSPFVVTNAPNSTVQNDSNDTTGTIAVATQGIINTVQNANPLTENNPAASYDFGVKPDSALAVSLSYAYAERGADGQIFFVWETATETGNAGFNLYMEVDGDLILVNTEMIPSTVIDAVEPVAYAYEANVAGELYYIEMIDLAGESERRGPFALGEEYGSSSIIPGGPDVGEIRNPLFLPSISGQ